MTDYEKEYRQATDVCGDPFPEFIAFFESATRPYTVLDLGCGQGRDALMAARFGHAVVGVDLAPTGISQMMAVAAAERLDVTGVVSDIEAYKPRTSFDVVILDRVLHMLPTVERRIAQLDRSSSLIRHGGFVLVADTRSNRKRIADYFQELAWVITLRRSDILFVKRP